MQHGDASVDGRGNGRIAHLLFGELECDFGLLHLGFHCPDVFRQRAPLHLGQHLPGRFELGAGDLVLGNDGIIGIFGNDALLEEEPGPLVALLRETETRFGLGHGGFGLPPFLGGSAGSQAVKGSLGLLVDGLGLLQLELQVHVVDARDDVALAHERADVAGEPLDRSRHLANHRNRLQRGDRAGNFGRLRYRLDEDGCHGDGDRLRSGGARGRFRLTGAAGHPTEGTGRDDQYDDHDSAYDTLRHVENTFLEEGAALLNGSRVRTGPGQAGPRSRRAAAGRSHRPSSPNPAPLPR